MIVLRPRTVTVAAVLQILVAVAFLSTTAIGLRYGGAQSGAATGARAYGLAATRVEHPWADRRNAVDLMAAKRHGR